MNWVKFNALLFDKFLYTPFGHMICCHPKASEKWHLKALKTLKDLKNTSQNVVKLQKDYLKVNSIYALLPSQQKNWRRC